MNFVLTCSADALPDHPADPPSVAAPRPMLEPVVARMAKGDQSALGELYDATSPLVYGLALRMLAKTEDAEEVTSDVYMKAWRHAANYSRERGSVPAWLVMMTRSLAIDRIRQRRSHRDGVPTLDRVAEPASPGLSPEQQAVTIQDRFRIQRALAALPAEQRELLEMAFFSGRSHAELAEETGLPLGTVKTRIRLGLQRLRTALGVKMGGVAE